jgi:hypothetical protein
VLFTGILFALGSFLYLYKGFSKREDLALNIAGVCAVVVAVFPMHAETGYIPGCHYVHFGAALVLFLSMAYAAIFCHQDTLKLIPIRIFIGATRSCTMLSAGSWLSSPS